MKESKAFDRWMKIKRFQLLGAMIFVVFVSYYHGGKMNSFESVAILLIKFMPFIVAYPFIDFFIDWLHFKLTGYFFRGSV